MRGAWMLVVVAGCGERNVAGPAAVAAPKVTAAKPEVREEAVRVQVSAGSVRSCARLDGGRVSCWGGLGEAQSPRLTPGIDDARMVSTSEAQSCALRMNGEVVCFGEKKAPAPVVGLTGVTALAVGTRSCAVHSGGRLRCWSSSGPVDVSGIDDAVAVSVSGLDDEVCVLRKSGRVACFDEGVPADVAGIEDAVSVSASFGRACVAHRTGRVSCWAKGFPPGSLMAMMPPSDWKMTPTPAPIPEIDDAVEVANGLEYACARRRNGAVSCWGSFAWRQGDERPKSVEGMAPAVQISAGAFHLCATLASGRVVCAGSNRDGQLARDPKSTFATAQRIPGIERVRSAVVTGYGTCAISHDDVARCWGVDPKEPAAEVSRREQPNVTQLAVASTSMQCLLRKDASVSCSSRDAGTSDVAGLGPAVEIAAGSDFACARTKSGAVSCWSDGTLAKTPLRIAGLGDAVRISASGTHACAVRKTGKIVCWGDNTGGELGDGPKQTGGTPLEIKGIDDAIDLATGYSFNCVLRKKGTVTCFGRDAPTLDVTDARAVAILLSRVCAARADGSVRCSGPPARDVPGARDAATLTSNGSTMCAVTKDGHLDCWGDNDRGQLGIMPFGTSARAVAIDL